MNATMNNAESTIENNIPFEATSLGDLIKSAREKRGLTLKDIAKKTKIHIGILNQLENNNLAYLPSKAYVKGFVKSVAKFLDINTALSMDLLEEAYDHLIFENLDLITLPPISKKESLILEKLTTLKKPLGTFDKMTVQKFSIFILVSSITIVGIISYINSTINGHSYTIAAKSTIENKSVPIPKAQDLPAHDEFKPSQIESSKAMTTSLDFPKHLETRNIEGILMPSNRF